MSYSALGFAVQLLRHGYFPHFLLFWKPCFTFVHKIQCSYGDNIWIKSYGVSIGFRKDEKLQKKKKNTATEARENAFQISKLIRQTPHLSGLQGQNTKALRQTSTLIFSVSLVFFFFSLAKLLSISIFSIRLSNLFLSIVYYPHLPFWLQ